jgi:hypothetical protein
MLQLDQKQYLNAAAAGFGQFAASRYRGMGFTPTLPFLQAISFDRNKGTLGIKIYIDTADVDSIPTNAVGSELYSFVVPNSKITGGFQIFQLPQQLPVTVGAQYCFYIAPWDTATNAYGEDYQDMLWTASDPYAGGKPIVNTAGTWAVSDGGNLDAMFETFGSSTGAAPVFVNKLRPRAFAPGKAR